MLAHQISKLSLVTAIFIAVVMLEFEIGKNLFLKELTK